jgi:hypothetical protein
MHGFSGECSGSELEVANLPAKINKNALRIKLLLLLI